MKRVSQSVSYSYDELPAQKTVIVGGSGEESHSLLADSLVRQGCRVVVSATCAELDSESLAGTGLVFVFASSLPEHSLYAQVGALLRRTRVDVVEVSTDRDYAASLYRFFRMRERRLLA